MVEISHALFLYEGSGSGDANEGSEYGAERDSKAVAEIGEAEGRDE